MTSPQSPLHNVAVCWVGNPRYTYPLNSTDDKKWALLNGLGICMFVVAFAAGLRPRRFTRHAHFYLMPELPISILRYAEMFLIAPLLLLWLTLRYDVQIIVAGSPFEGAIGAVVKNIARLLGKRVKLVVESHGDFEVAVLEQRRVFAAGVYRWFMMQAAHYGLRHATVCRAVSNSTRQQLEQWQPGTPIVQFITWTDTSAFRSQPRQLAVSQARDLLYAGVLVPRKGVHILLDSFAVISTEISDAHLWLVGKAENAAYTSDLQQQVERLGLNGRVTFVGAVNQRELSHYMGRSRALILASLSEGLPRVVVEAMLNGLVVIASRVSGTPEIVEDGVTGYLIPPADVNALTEAIRNMYRNPDLEVMAVNARAVAEQRFSNEAYVEGYHRLLEIALNLW